MNNSRDNSELGEKIIDNKKPINPFAEPDKSRYENLLNNLQGGIIKNYGRNHSLYLFIAFKEDKINEVKQWIQKKADMVTSTYQQLEDTKNYKKQLKEYLEAEKQESKSSSEKPSGELCVNFFLSSNGYKVLGFNNVEQILTDPEFKQGMKEWYQEFYKDNISYVPPNNWDVGGSDDIDIHALTLLAHDDLSQLEEAATQVIEEIEGREIGNLVACEAGYVLKSETKDGDGERLGSVIGPFDFVDNLSQPLFLKSDLDKYEKKQGITKQEELKWDPFAPLKLVLVEDPFQPGQYGSYCVWQKLETDYQCFTDKEQELANKLGVDRERAGALIVGRFRDGTPIELSPKQQGGDRNNNDFNYNDDQNGMRCPLHAHIRKVNPRGDQDPDNSNSPPLLSSQKKSRIFRAGITYFDDLKVQPTSEPKNSQSCFSKLEYLREVSRRTLEENVKGIGGLLFVCFQSSITTQFSTLQISWANDAAFPRKLSNKKKYLDPVIGDSPEEEILPQEWPEKWNQEQTEDFRFQGCVKNKGGEFFFAPSISFLQRITDIGN